MCWLNHLGAAIEGRAEKAFESRSIRPAECELDSPVQPVSRERVRLSAAAATGSAAVAARHGRESVPAR